MQENVGKRSTGANVPSLQELKVPQCHWSVGHKLGLERSEMRLER